jgi:hypothetical protein
MGARLLEVHPEAYQELDEARLWYEDHASGKTESLNNLAGIFKTFNSSHCSFAALALCMKVFACLHDLTLQALTYREVPPHQP